MFHSTGSATERHVRRVRIVRVRGTQNSASLVTRCDQRKELLTIDETMHLAEGRAVVMGEEHEDGDFEFDLVVDWELEKL